MGFSFSGHVLRGATTAPSNSVTSGEPDTGVVRCPRPVPAAYTLKTGVPVCEPPAFVDPAADQYRAAILEAPGTTPVEYLVWAENTASLAWVDDPTWWVEEGSGSIPTGTLQVLDLAKGGLFQTDGASRVVIRDNGNRSISRIQAVVVARGDIDALGLIAPALGYDDDGWKNPEDVNPASYGGQPRDGVNPYVTLYFEATEQNPAAGLVYLTDAHLTLLGGGLSKTRGDRVVAVHYSLASSRFWWTRNDRYESRFGWNGQTRRWEAFKGTGVQNLGRLEVEKTYRMTPKIKNMPVGATLPGSSLYPDTYSMLRVGVTPGAAGVPVEGVRIKTDAEAENFDFALDPTASAVVGQTSGILTFNPSFTALHAGETIWYSYRGFTQDADGVVGPMRRADVAPLYLAPIPGPTDHPLIHFGTRTALLPTLVENDADLGAVATVPSGSVVVSLSTGRLRFNPEDLQRADPSWPNLFNKHFLGENVIYRGVALCSQPQPTRAPTQLLDGAGAPATAQSDELFIPDYIGLPEEFALDNPRRGLGASGVMDAPDGTGVPPNGAGSPATVRPGGDTVGARNLGRVRQVGDGVGDHFIFSQNGALLTIVEVNQESDLPDHGFKIRKTKAYVARERGTWGSKVKIGRGARRKFKDKALYFLQASLTPAVYTDRAKLHSRNRDIFRFTGSETFYFAVDGVAYQWAPTTLLSANPTATYFTSVQVAASIQADTLPALPAGRATEMNGRIILTGATSVEIGFGTGGERDLSGSAVLGFPPGWRAVDGVQNWLPDSGVSLGLTRSPANKDRSSAIADYSAVDRIEDLVLYESVQAMPFQFLDNPPLQDVAGYDEGVFFYLRAAILNGDEISYIQKPLEHYRDIVHRFGQRKFDWVERQNSLGIVDRTLTTLNLGNPSLVPESLLGVPSISSGLLVASDGGSYDFQDPDTDFILPQDGTPGTVTLVERFGGLVLYGSRAHRLGTNEFWDNSATFVTRRIQPGYRLKIMSGDNAGSYIVTEVLTETSIKVSPNIPTQNSYPMTWEMFTGFTEAVYDPALVADRTYKVFNHLPAEPFTVRTLRRVGDVPATAVDLQAARPRADLAEAINKGREIGLRFGAVPASTGFVAQLTALLKKELGVLANNALTIPNTGTDRFTTGAFSIQVGTVTYTQGIDLIGVASFSPDPYAVEYLQTPAGQDPAGRLKFGTSVLSALTGSRVYYQETFLAPSLLVAGMGEVDPNTGSLNLSDADMVQHGGARLYVTERLVTENRQDVSINPMLGAFSPNVPLPKGTIMETEYWRADLEGRKIGDQISEFLPVRIRRESAILVSPNVYKFNDGGAHTVKTEIAPDVWIGAMLQNFGQIDYMLDYPPDWNGAGRVVFISKQVAASDPVSVSYSVYEAQGGERGYEASQKNVYRPPFYIKANQNRFGLRGDRTAEFLPGQMLRIGEDCFYIRSLKFFPPTSDGKGNVTEVGIYPSTVTEVGSRAPGNDVLTLITDKPITTVVDPSGATPVPTTAPAGFMSTVDTTLFPFEAVCGGQKTIFFRGNLTQFAVPGHILELGGCPYTIANAELTEDGARTKISVTGGFSRAFDVLTHPQVKLSFRPVYPPDTRDLLGAGPVLESEPVELVLFGERLEDGSEAPGRTLTPEVHFHLDTNSGSIQLINPAQAPLSAGQRLLLSFTRLRALQPYLQDQVLILPRYVADYLAVTTPSEENGRLGATLSATYTFSSPDSFYFRAVKLNQFMGEVAQEAIQEITSKQPAGGAFKTSIAGSKNWNQGNNGLKAERRHLSDVDRAARAFLAFYNDTIVAFEQIRETISGGFIGDRSGKFRFWVGHGLDYPTPGYEDSITGTLQTRNIWQDIVNANREAGSPVFLDSDDWVVAPDSVTLVDMEVSGSFPKSDELTTLVDRQGLLIRNDIDDLVMTHLGRVQISYLPELPYFSFRAKGVFARMGEQHAYSRLFPTRTRAFLRMFPGAGAQLESGSAFNAGVYTAGRKVNGEWARTTGTQIGQLSNPVLGEISSVQDATLTQRRARGRIWGYFPNGIPAGAFSGGVSLALPMPCLVVTPLLLSEVPIDPETGYPDNAQFLSNTPPGTLPDAYTGDAELATPGFEVGDQICWGKPDGSVLGAFTPVTDSLWGTTSPTGIFVAGVVYGCVVLLQDKDGNLLVNPDDILVVDTPAHQFPIERGDTVFCVTPAGEKSANPPVPGANPTFQDLFDVAAKGDTYKSGFDLSVKADGSIVDRTLPSKDDPAYFPLKEMLGQNPPPPMGSVEGSVEFLYDSQNPLVFPALTGGTTNDFGDYSIPYLRTGNTEIERFSEITVNMAAAMTARTATFPTLAVYPDEILGVDGAVVGSGTDPATLTTVQDLTPIAHGGADPGTGDVRMYDLLLVQEPYLGEDSKFSTSLGFNLGPHGILTVGRVEATMGGSVIEPPRFVTSTAEPPPGSTNTGDGVRYNLTNAMVFVDGTYPADPQVPPPTPGVVIIEDVLAGLTILDFSSVPIFLNDGQTIGTGNLNDIYSSTVPVLIRMFARPDPNIVFGMPGVNPLPSTTGGVEVLRIMIWSGFALIWTYQDNPLGAPSVALALGAPAVFGTQTVPVFPAGDNKQIHLPITGLLPWAPVGPPPPGWAPNKWFLPHTVGAGPVYTTMYGFEFAFDLDARGFLYFLPLPPAWESMTAWVDADRLTFQEVIDLRFAKARGEVHPLNPALSLATELVVHEVQTGLTGGTQYWSTVNAGINGFTGLNPTPLTFLARGVVPFVGAWAPRVGPLTERGSLRSMSFEGWANTPLTGADVSFSTIPSCDYPKGSAVNICSGVGLTGSRLNPLLSAADAARVDCRIVTDVAVLGVDRIQSGDVAVIRNSANATHPGTPHQGTYLVRHAVVPTAGSSRKVAPKSEWGSSGWSGVQFPTVLGYDAGTNILTISDLAGTPDGPVVGAFHSGFAVPGLTTRIFVLVTVANLASTSEQKFRDAVVSARYTVMGATADGRGLFTLTDFRDANGDLISEAAFQALAVPGTRVSGMVYLPTLIAGAGYGLPENNCVGVDDGINSIYGFQRLTLTPPVYLRQFSAPGDDALPRVFNAAGMLGASNGFIDRVAGVDTLVPIAPLPESGHQFLADPTTPVYHFVTRTLDVQHFGNANFDALNVPSGSWGGGVASGVRCVLPGTILELGSEDLGPTWQPGFEAQAGIFFEPSVPRTCLNLAPVPDYVRVVDKDHSLPDPLLAASDQERELWMRDANTYRVSGSLPNVPDEVQFTVRRIRRFHAVGGSAENLLPLRYAYEIRRGFITSRTETLTGCDIVTASNFTMDWETTKPGGAPKAQDLWSDGLTYSGTNLGFFFDQDVNIHAGDMFRLLDANGDVVDEVPIIAVLSATQVLLAPPGLRHYDSANGVVRFEIWLRQAPVPHEQTNEQLRAILSDKEVYRTDASWGDPSEKGGYVPEVAGALTYEDNVNKLYDDLRAPGAGQTFSLLGVKKGDIVVVDPSGVIPQQAGLPTLQESGVRPLGDEGVPGRVDSTLAPVYTAGRPNPLDDNRGWYRVKQVVDSEDPPYLLVDPVTDLTGTGAVPVIFDLTDNTRAYSVYPTVNDSSLSTDGTEGQMDLRPTRSRNPLTGSFKVYPDGLNKHSIRPFSYKVFRPTQFFEPETADLILSTRERMLSLIELIQRIGRWKGGSYFLFQRDAHLYDVGSPTDPELGLGVASNDYLWSVVGRVDVMPFSNGSSCLSLLDRRFWILDNQLDSLTYDPASGLGMKRAAPGDPTYTAYNTSLGGLVRPVLPDRVDEVLDQIERLREIRYTWLSYRTHKVLGTLSALTRYDAELPERLKEQEQFLLQTLSMEKA